MPTDVLSPLRCSDPATGFAFEGRHTLIQRYVGARFSYIASAAHASSFIVGCTASWRLFSTLTTECRFEDLPGITGKDPGGAFSIL